jgi:hypothetical protein
MLGGILLIGDVIAVATRPIGCIGSECDVAGRSMRQWGDLAPFFITALLLVIIGLAGLVIRAHRANCLGTVGRVGLVTAIIGVALLALGGGIQEIFFGGDFPLMPLFVLPGILGLVIGFLLVGVVILRAKVLPGWAAWLLIVSALAMLGFNDQNARVLMAVPFGVAWVAVGYVLWSSG